MSQRFLKIITTSDDIYVSEYRKLGNIEKYLKRVFYENKPLNVWHVISEVHPDSGEAVLYRRRLVLNGKNIVAVEEVVPTESRRGNDYSPNLFQPKPVIEKGQYGTWTAPTTEGALVVDARPGATYPIHRDPESVRRYVVLKAGEGEDEIRHYLDPERPQFGGYETDQPAGRDDFNEDTEEEEDSF